MPERIAIRELALDYEEECQQEIVAFLNSKVKFDYLGNNRELDLDLTVDEAYKLYTASDEIVAAAESGALKELHEERQMLDERVRTNYLICMETLERTLAQITQSEQEIYDGISDVTGMRRHGEVSIYDSLSLTTGGVSIDNYQAVKAAAKDNAQLDQACDQLKQLLGARQQVYTVKTHLLEDYTQKIDKTDVALNDELDKASRAAEYLSGVFGGDAENLTGDAKVFSEQVNKLRTGELETLINAMSDHQRATEKNKAIFADWNQDGVQKMDDFRRDLL